MPHPPYPANYSPDHHRYTYIIVTIDPSVDKTLAANPRNLRGKLHNPRSFEFIGLATTVPSKSDEQPTIDYKNSSIWSVPKNVDPEMVLSLIRRTKGITRADILEPEWRRKNEL